MDKKVVVVACLGEGEGRVGDEQRKKRRTEEEEEEEETNGRRRRDERKKKRREGNDWNEKNQKNPGGGD